MAKRVIYNGGTQGYGSYSDPSVLTVGKGYEVVTENVYNWHTDYTLRGIKGTFNSVWFDEVKPNVTDDKVYIAVADNMPEIGESLVCYKFIEEMTDNLEIQCKHWQTAPVTAMEVLSNNVCVVETYNSTYYVFVKSTRGINNTHIVISKELPKIDESFECLKLVENTEKNQVYFTPCNVVQVKKIASIGNNIYAIETVNKRYILKVYR